MANGLPVRPCVTTMPRSNRPEHTRRNAMRSRCALSMLACTLNTKPANGSSSGRGSPSTSSRAAGGGTSSITVSSSSRTPKFVSAEPNSIGVVSPARNSSWSWSVPASSSRSSSHCDQASPSSSAARAASTSSSCASVAPRAVRVNRVNSPVRRSTTPRKSPEMPTGHVTGVHTIDRWDSMSSMSSMPLRPGRSHLLTNVMSGRPRSRHTSNSLSVCGSMPFAASRTITAASQAVSTR